MSAINLLINEKIISYEIQNNGIILKKNNNTIYEFPIPEGYYLAGTIDYEEIREIKEKRFIITKNYPVKPSSIPVGFENLQISIDGTWCAEGAFDSRIQRKGGRKRIKYIDTSSLTLDDFDYVYYENERARFLFENGFKIPDSFWISSDYHSDYYNMSRAIRDIPNYMKDFDYRARLIKEDECMSLIALDFSMKLTLVVKNLYNVCGYCGMVPHELGIDTPGSVPDNWPIVSTSIENQNVYRLLWPQLVDLSHNPFYSNYAVDVSYDKPEPYLLFPVIDDTKEKTLKYNIMN